MTHVHYPLVSELKVLQYLIEADSIEDAPGIVSGELSRMLEIGEDARYMLTQHMSHEDLIAESEAGIWVATHTGVAYFERRKNEVSADQLLPIEYSEEDLEEYQPEEDAVSPNGVTELRTREGPKPPPKPDPEADAPSPPPQPPRKKRKAPNRRTADLKETEAPQRYLPDDPAAGTLESEVLWYVRTAGWHGGPEQIQQHCLHRGCACTLGEVEAALQKLKKGGFIREYRHKNRRDSPLAFQAMSEYFPGMVRSS